MSDEMNETWVLFASEGRENLEAVERCALELEQGFDQERVNELYRAMHTLKGNARMMGLGSMEGLAHHAEDVVGLVRDHGHPLDAHVIDLVLQCLDHLGRLLTAAEEVRGDVPCDEAKALQDVLAGYAGRHRPKISLTPSQRALPSEHPGDLFYFSQLPEALASIAPVGSTVLAATEGGPPAAAEEDAEVVKIFLEAAIEHLDRLRDALDQFEDEASSADARDRASMAVEALHFASSRMGYPRVSVHLEELQTQLSAGSRDVPLLQELVGRIMEEVARLEEAAERMTSLSPRRDAEEDRRPVAADAVPAGPGAGAKPQHAPATEPRATKARPKKEREVEKEDQLIRLSASKVDALMSLAGEINLALGSVLYHPELEGLDLTGYSAAAHRVEMLIRELQDSTAGLGLTPVAGVFNRTRRLVRDLARQTGKDIKLVIDDNETEIDRMLVDRIYEPLIHIIRNAADHGLESSDERVAAGKPAQGTIKLVAAQEGGSILIRIEDDGRGLDTDKIVAIARRRGVIGPDEAVSDERARKLIFAPGFSTADEVSNLSGRGVGLDVVSTTLEDLNGRVVVDSARGRGTRVDLHLPLTLAFAEVIVVEVAGQLFAIPMSAVSSIFRPDSTHVTDITAEGETVVRVLDELIPVTWLERFYGEGGASDGSRAAAGRIIVAVQTRRGKRAVPIERIVGAERVTMKSLPEPMRNIRAAAGCGVLRSGEVAIALDCERLIDERAA